MSNTFGGYPRLFRARATEADTAPASDAKFRLFRNEGLEGSYFFDPRFENRLSNLLSSGEFGSESINRKGGPR